MKTEDSEATHQMIHNVFHMAGAHIQAYDWSSTAQTVLEQRLEDLNFFFSAPMLQVQRFNESNIL